MEIDLIRLDRDVARAERAWRAALGDLVRRGAAPPAADADGPSAAEARARPRTRSILFRRVSSRTTYLELTGKTPGLGAELGLASPTSPGRAGPDRPHGPPRRLGLRAHAGARRLGRPRPARRGLARAAGHESTCPSRPGCRPTRRASGCSPTRRAPDGRSSPRRSPEDPARSPTPPASSSSGGTRRRGSSRRRASARSRSPATLPARRSAPRALLRRTESVIELEPTWRSARARGRPRRGVGVASAARPTVDRGAVPRHEADRRRRDRSRTAAAAARRGVVRARARPLRRGARAW